jgi:capsular polysaccharide biosynthesis protein
MVNEDELFEALKPYGFKKYFLEDLSMDAEIELFYDADYVVGIFGAGLTNMIFSDQIKILELFPSEFVEPNYYYLAKSLGHTYGYYNGYCNEPEEKLNSRAGRRIDFIVNVSAVVESLLALEKQHQSRIC